MKEGTDGGVSNKVRVRGSEQTSVDQKPLSVDQWFDNNPRRHKAQNKIKKIHEKIPPSCWAAYDRFLRTEGIQNDNEEILSKLENAKAESIYALRNNEKLYEARSRAEIASVLFEEAQEQQDAVDEMRKDLAHEKLVVSYGNVKPTPMHVARKKNNETSPAKLPEIELNEIPVPDYVDTKAKQMRLIKDARLQLGEFQFEEEEEIPQVTNYAGSKGPRWRPAEHQGYGDLFKSLKNRKKANSKTKNERIDLSDLKDFEQRRAQPSSFHFKARQGMLLQ